MAMTTSPQTRDEMAPSWAGAIVVGATVGSVCALSILPAWLSYWQGTLLGASPQAFWYLSRSSGVVAYVAFTLSMALGLLTTNRLARVWPGGPLATDLHEYLSLLGLTLAGFHVLILLGDHWINYSLFQLVVPMTADYRPMWVALGQLGFGLGLPVILSFYVRDFIGLRTWRLLHGATFVFYVLVTLHGFGAGTDTPSLASLYSGSVVLIIFLTIYRVLASRMPARAVGVHEPRTTVAPSPPGRGLG
jgi:predicted ferric reductase